MLVTYHIYITEAVLVTNGCNEWASIQSICMYVYVWVCVFMGMYVSEHVYVWVCVCIIVCVCMAMCNCVCMGMCMYVYVCVSVYLCIYV